MDLDVTIALITSLLAFIISLINISINQKKITSEVITTNRINWIIDVRELVKKFIDIYVKDDKSIELTIIRNQIYLYMRQGVTSYSKLIEQLDKCIKQGYNKQNCDDLILKAQIVFSDVWVRMKREAGIKKQDDDRIFELFERNNRS